MPPAGPQLWQSKTSSVLPNAPPLRTLSVLVMPTNLRVWQLLYLGSVFRKVLENQLFPWEWSVQPEPSAFLGVHPAVGERVQKRWVMVHLWRWPFVHQRLNWRGDGDLHHPYPLTVNPLTLMAQIHKIPEAKPRVNCGKWETWGQGWTAQGLWIV